MREFTQLTYVFSWLISQMVVVVATSFKLIMTIELNALEMSIDF